MSNQMISALYNWLMRQMQVRQMFDPLRRATAGQAHGIVLEVGAGAGQNFPFYDPTRVVRVEAAEPDEAMLSAAEPSRQTAPVPIRLSRAPVEVLPFPPAQIDSAVATLVFCSVQDPACGLHEIWRVLKPGGTLLLLEHVRGPGKIVSWIEDALAPLTRRCMGNCHWNRNTQQLVLDTGFRATPVRMFSGGFQPMLFVQAIQPETSQDLPPQSSDTVRWAR